MPLLLEETNVNPVASPACNFIVEVDAKNFAAEVINSSHERLVLVDFWAPWCAPCKQLLPLMDKLVLERKGAIRLAKINIDANGQLATQMRVQSVPTVLAFFQGQPVDGFTGAVTEPQLKSWIDRLVTATGSVPPGEKNELNLEEALAHAQGALDELDIETARLIYTDILKQSPMEARAFAGTLWCLLAEGKTQMAAEILDQAHEDIKKSKALDPIRSAIELACQAETKAGERETFEQKVAADPYDHTARFDLAMSHYAAGAQDRAIDELLEIVRRDRKWNDEAARKQLIKLFEILGSSHTLTVQARKRLSSILFA